MTEPEEDKSEQNDADADKSSQLSDRSKMTQMREAIIKDSTKAIVPDKYHHLFMDPDDSEQEKKRKPKMPLKRIKTIVVKKRAAMKRSDEDPNELTTVKSSKKLKKLKSEMKPRVKSNL